MAVRMPRLTLGGRTEHGRNVVVTLDVGALGEVQVTAIGLRLAGKRILQILFGFRTFQRHDV